MSIRLRAFLYTLGVFGATVIGAMATAQILNAIPERYYGPIAVTVIVGLLFNLVYSSCKSWLEIQEKYKNLADKK
jgi:uncharacterized membrane protein YadS